MQALWVSLKENVQCGAKLSDVVRQPVKCSKENSCVPEKENLNRDNGHSMESLVQLHELGIGDPSRKIVEMIFHKAWTSTSKPVRKIRRVLRVRNSAEVLERFEKYREKVKKKACEEYPRHPRSIVDGNELLRFYGTTMRCCHGKSGQKVKELCMDPSCRVCQIIQFNVNSEYCKSKELGDNKIAITRVKTERKAVIVCRIIAGAAIHEVDGEVEGSDSSGLGEKVQFRLEKFVVRNPSAILPCFVIVFS